MKERESERGRERKKGEVCRERGAQEERGECSRSDVHLPSE